MTARVSGILLGAAMAGGTLALAVTTSPAYSFDEQQPQQQPQTPSSGPTTGTTGQTPNTPNNARGQAALTAPTNLLNGPPAGAGGLDRPALWPQELPPDTGQHVTVFLKQRDNPLADLSQSRDLPAYINDRPPPGSRERILSGVRETGDIARAAELLVQEGSIVYDQSSTEDFDKIATSAAGGDREQFQAIKSQLDARFIGSATGDDLLDATRGACHDFVHFSAYLAGSGQGGQLPTYGTGTAALIDPDKMQEWDGESEIPRGKIIVGTVSGCMGGQDQYGFFHVAVSLGNGLVANNRGSGVQIERAEDVFGSFYTNPAWGRGIFFGDYVGYGLPDSARKFLEGEHWNNNDLITLYRDGGIGADLSPEARSGAITDLQNRNSIIDYQLGQGPLPDSSLFTGDVADYQQFLGQAISGIAQHEPFFYVKFAQWQASQTPSQPQATATFSSAATAAVPSERPLGEETAHLIVQYFNITEVSQLGVPPVEGR